MCGRYALYADPETLVARFDLWRTPDLRPRYNIAPSQEIPAIRRSREGRRELTLLRWGLVPHWATETSGHSMINARAETVATKPAFRGAFRWRRCLIPADGFYEWKKAGRIRQPYFIRPKDGLPLAFAGLWEEWRSPDGQAIGSCAIIVTRANALLQPIHDRMPVILEPHAYGPWLSTDITDTEDLTQLLVPFPPENMKAYPVDRWVNNPRNEGAACVGPVIE
ncbi:MAG: SOS response-associated peptidase [Pseudomonadota bacterium]|nr:SOS response-associated peptidase [Pseudomonadota bacterium]